MSSHQARVLTLKNLVKVCEMHIGPEQYLQSLFTGNPDAVDKFVAWLKCLLQPRLDKEYVHGNMVLGMNTTYVHVWQLSFERSSSTKPPAYADTCKALAEEFLVNTLITDNDPPQVVVRFGGVWVDERAPEQRQFQPELRQGRSPQPHDLVHVGHVVFGQLASGRAFP